MGTNHLTLAEMRGLPPEKLASLTMEEVELLQSEVTELKASTKSAVDFFDGYLSDRYATIAGGLRLQAGKDAGTVRIDQGQHEVVADQPKKVLWDQKVLSSYAEKIRAAGDNVADFMDIEYSIPEKKFAAFADDVKAAFTEARTVKVGKQTFKVVAKGEK